MTLGEKATLTISAYVRNSMAHLYESTNTANISLYVVIMAMATGEFIRKHSGRTISLISRKLRRHAFREHMANLRSNDNRGIGLEHTNFL
jgi:hypothetical protein